MEASHPLVRYELASALMHRDGVGVMALEQVVTHLLDPLDGNQSGTAAPSPTGICTFVAPSSLEAFDPLAVDVAAEVFSARPTLRRTTALLSSPDRPSELPALPLALTDLDVCQAFSGGDVQYDRSAVLAAVRDRFGSDWQVTGALVVDAVGHVLTAYSSLFDPEAFGASWYVVDGHSIGACVDGLESQEFTGHVRSEMERIGKAIITLDLLLEHTGNSRHASWMNDALDVYASLVSHDTDPCTD
jgi:hypothetical protein